MIPAVVLTALVCLWAVLTVRVGSLVLKHRIRRLYYAPLLMFLLILFGLDLVLDGTRYGFYAPGVVALILITVVMVVYPAMALFYARTGFHQLTRAETPSVRAGS